MVIMTAKVSKRKILLIGLLIILAVVVLIAAIAGLGLAPLWVSDMVREGILPIVQHLTANLL